MDEILQVCVIALGLFVLPHAMQSIPVIRAMRRSGKISGSTHFAIRFIGAALAIGSIFAGYPVTPSSWVWGMPFTASLFEYTGEMWMDRSGPVSYLIAACNFIFWYCVPYLVVSITKGTSSSQIAGERI